MRASVWSGFFGLAAMAGFAAIAALTILGSDSAEAAAASNPTEKVQHCTVNINPLQPGAKASEVSAMVCFDTFSEAVAHGTRGAVQLPAASVPTDLTQAILSENQAKGESQGLLLSTVIGVDYKDANYQGSSLTWTTGDPNGCSAGATFYADYTPSGWDNNISSAIGYQGCNNYRHFRDVGRFGPYITCTCATMGSMNNQTSAEEWAP